MADQTKTLIEYGPTTDGTHMLRVDGSVELLHAKSGAIDEAVLELIDALKGAGSEYTVQRVTFTRVVSAGGELPRRQAQIKAEKAIKGKPAKRLKSSTSKTPRAKKADITEQDHADGTTIPAEAFTDSFTDDVFIEEE